MPQQPVSTSCLHVFDVDSGSWVEMMLGSGVSPRIREAMNLILKQDGILAYIGTRSELGEYLQSLKKDHGTDFLHSWISYPGSTILSKLGLCLNMQISGRSELTFNGSPLVLMLAYRLELSEVGEINNDIDLSLKTHNPLLMEHSQLRRIGFHHDVLVTADEQVEVDSYLKDHFTGLFNANQVAHESE